MVLQRFVGEVLVSAVLQGRFQTYCRVSYCNWQNRCIDLDASSETIISHLSQLLWQMRNSIVQ
jgi:hypothetical protein